MIYDNTVDNIRSKEIYSTPRLVQYGNVEQITQGQGFGIRDLFVYGLADPIGRRPWPTGS